MRRVVSAVAASSLILGFVVAQVTGVRALGGVVLLLGVIWCALHWRRTSLRLAMVLAGVYVLAFVGSHLLAKIVGAWPAVFAVAAVMGWCSYVGMGRSGDRVHTM